MAGEPTDMVGRAGRKVVTQSKRDGPAESAGPTRRESGSTRSALDSRPSCPQWLSKGDEIMGEEGSNPCTRNEPLGEGSCI